MNFLARPIFPWTPDWSQAVSRRATFELRESDIGFGVPWFSPTQQYTVNGWTFKLTLQAADIAALDAFTAALFGRLTGFWLPVPFDPAVIVAGIDASNFKVAGEQLSTFWADRPDIYLMFTFADGTQAAAQIAAVAANGDGTETVTLAAPLPQVPAAATWLQRLHYVRLADDAESADFISESLQQREINVVELPLEYAAAETGLQPIYLYDFSCDAPIGLHWRYTSFAANVVSGGMLFSAFPIGHQSIKQGTDGQDNELTIEAKPDLAHPFSLFTPLPPGKPLWVRIYLASYAAPDATTLLFAGRVTKVLDTGAQYRATAETVMGRLKYKLPRSLMEQTCPYQLYDQGTCRAGRAWFETTLVFVSQTADQPPVLKCTFAIALNQDRNQAENFFQYGLIEGGLGTKYEIRSIIASHWNAGTGQLELTLNFPFSRLQAGDQLQCVAGCDHTLAMCTNKFNNAANHTSFTQVPQTNLSLNAITATGTSSGNKKSS